MADPKLPRRLSFVERLLGRTVEPLPSADLATTAAAPVVRQRKSVLGSTGVHFVGPDIVNSRLIWLEQTGLSRDAPELTRATAFLTSAYCYGAMMWRAMRLAEPPLMVVREDEDGEQWVPEHPLNALLEAPRPDVDMGEMLSRTQLYRDLTGACLWVVDRNNAGERAIVTPFAAPEFKSEKEGPLLYGRYAVKTAEGWRPVPVEDVVHFRDVDPGDWRTPASKVDVALLNLDLGHNVNRIVRRFLEKAMFPGGIISSDPEWHPSPDEWDQAKEAIEQWSAGPANAGAPLWLPGGATFSRAASALADLVPGAVLDRVEATVSAIFGVPPVVLGWLTGLQNSPWSQMAEARASAYQDTMVPLWRDGERRLSRAWLTPEERAAGIMVRFDVSEIRALQPDQEQASRVAALNADHWTVDERRLHTGQDALPDGDPRGEVIVGLQPPAPAPDSIGLAGPGPDAKGVDMRDLVWLLFDMDSKAAESTWERQVYAHLQMERVQVVKLSVEELGPAWKREARQDGEAAKREQAHKDAASDAVNAYLHKLKLLLEASGEELVSTTYPLLVSTGGKAVRRLSARVGLSFRVLEPGLLKYAAEEADFLSHVMGTTTGKAVAAAVQDSLAAGETIAALAKRLEELPAFDRPRAQVVARTETTRAWNGAQRRSMSEFSRATGRRTTKTWLTSRDDRVRDEHAILDEEVAGIDQPFSDGQMAPGEPNCRCTLIYSVADPEGGGSTDVEATP